MSRLLYPARPLSQVVTVGNLFRDISRVEIVKLWCALWVGVWATVGFREYVDRYTPSVIRTQTESMHAVIYKDEIVLHLQQYMPRNSCAGGIVARRLIREWGPSHPPGIPANDPKDIAFIKEHDIPWTRKGKHDFYIHIHLQGPVQGQGWQFVFERYDNCSWLDDFFPSTPITQPDVPAENTNASPPQEPT